MDILRYATAVGATVASIAIVVLQWAGRRVHLVVVVVVMMILVGLIVDELSLWPSVP